MTEAVFGLEDWAAIASIAVVFIGGVKWIRERYNVWADTIDLGDDAKNRRFRSVCEVGYWSLFFCLLLFWALYVISDIGYLVMHNHLLEAHEKLPVDDVEILSFEEAIIGLPSLDTSESRTYLNFMRFREFIVDPIKDLVLTFLLLTLLLMGVLYIVLYAVAFIVSDEETDEGL